MTIATTIRLPEELKEPVSSAAERTGQTRHSLILEAIAERTELEEPRASCDSEAGARFARIVRSGMTIAWADMRHDLEERLAGKRVTPPL